MAVVSPLVPITLDKPRTLFFGFEACESLEAQMNGVPLMDAITRIRNVSLTTLTTALWAGLKHEDQTLTVSLTKKIVKSCLANGMNYLDLSVPVVEAIDRSGLFSTKEEDTGNAPTTTEPAKT